jgi:hypothetical protein
MKAAVGVFLAPFLMATAPIPVQAQSQWNSVCETVGRFTAALAQQRDRRIAFAPAIEHARTGLPGSEVITADVAEELARQVYHNPGLRPDQAADNARTRCLAVQETRLPILRAENGTHVISDLRAIPLQTGVNRIDRFAPDGRPADVRLSWKDDGHGKGHDVFAADVPGAGTVRMPGGDSISDDPQNDSDMARSVRFASGRVDGEPATLLLLATRGPGRAATATTYQVYRLDPMADGFGFALVSERALPRPFCNADMALSVASGLPLRVSYRGALTPDGCAALKPDHFAGSPR